MYLLIPMWNYRGVYGEFADNFFSFITLFKLSLCPPIGDFVFYFSHRICHLNHLYSSVHKLHHEWKVPVAVAAAYTTKAEYVFCNLPTFLLPPLLLLTFNSSVNDLNELLIDLKNNPKKYVHFSVFGRK